MNIFNNIFPSVLFEVIKATEKVVKGKKKRING